MEAVSKFYTTYSTNSVGAMGQSMKGGVYSSLSAN